MRVLRLVSFVVLLTAVPLVARDVPTISSLGPNAIHVASGEWFLAINGTRYLPLSGVSVIFSGPAGTLSRTPNSATDTRMEVWIPEQVVLTPGYYTVKVRVPEGDSNVATFRVIGGGIFLRVPDMVLVEAINLEGGYGQFVIEATSALGEQTYIDCSHRSGEFFPFGVTEVDCKAYDDYGGSVQESFRIETADRTPPALLVPNEVIAFGKEDGAEVSFEVKAEDVVDPQIEWSCSQEPGSFFRVGSTTVLCTSVDRFKNEGTAEFRVHVGTERVPALILPPRVLAEATSREGAVVEFETRAVLSNGERVEVKCDPGPQGQFRMGETPVKCVAEGPGGSASGEFVVDVADRTAPTLNLPRDFTEQAPSAEGAYVRYDASAKDAVDGEAFVACYPASGTLFPAGQTTVHCATTDEAKNESTGSFVVTVLPWFDDTVYAMGDTGSEQ